MVRKIISIIIIFSFFTSPSVFAGNARDLSTLVGNEVNASQIAVPSIFDDLTGIQHKDIGRVKLSLEACFGLGNNKIDMKALCAAGEKYKDSIFDGAHFFFHEAEPLGNGYFSIKCRLSDKKSGIRTYTAVFPTGKTLLEGFPVEVFTQDEWERSQKDIEELVNSGRPLSSLARSYHKPSDDRAIQRYILHEKGVDTVIRVAAGEGLVKRPIASRFDYKKTAEDLLKELRVDVQDTPGLVRPEDRDFFVIKLTGKIKELMNKLPKPLIVDSKTGKEHQVSYSAHSSSNAVYVFVDEKDFDLLTEEKVTWPEDKAKPEGEKQLPAKNDIMEMSDEEILALFDPRYGEMKKHVSADLRYTMSIKDKIAEVLDFRPSEEDEKMLRVLCLVHDIGGTFGYDAHDRTEKLFTDLAVEYKIEVKGKTPQEIIEAFRGKGVDLAHEMRLRGIVPDRSLEESVAVADHQANSRRVLQRLGIKVPEVLLEVIAGHMDVPSTEEWVSWKTNKKWLYLSFTIGDVFECGNKYCIPLSTTRKGVGFEAVDRTLVFLKDVKFGGNNEMGRAVSAAADLVKEGKLDETILFSRTPIQFTDLGAGQLTERLEFMIAHELGVMLGCPAEVKSDERTIDFQYVTNELDERYRYLKVMRADSEEKALKASTEAEKKKILEEEGWLRFKPVDLDKELPARDYAAAAVLEMTGTKAVLEQTAHDIGMRIAPPVNDFVIFVTPGFCSKGEMEADRRVYGDRFRLEFIPKVDIVDIVNDVIGFVDNKKNGILPENVIIQLSPESGDKRYNEALNRLRARGIRFILTDIDVFEGEYKKSDLRRDIYMVMLLTRALGKYQGADAEIHKLLDYLSQPYITRVDNEALEIYDFIMKSDSLDFSEQGAASGMARFVSEITRRIGKMTVYDEVLRKWYDLMLMTRLHFAFANTAAVIPAKCILSPPLGSLVFMNIARIFLDDNSFAYTFDNVEYGHKPGEKAAKTYNPGRAAKRKPDEKLGKGELFCEYDDNKFNFTKIREWEILSRDKEINGISVDFIVNKYPFMEGHMLLVPERLAGRHPQFFTEKAADVILGMLRTADRKSFKIAFNSLGAFASVNHLHIQAMEYDMYDRMMPVEREERKLLFETGGVSVSTLPGWFIRTFVLSSSDETALKSKLADLAGILNEKNIPYNIVGTYDGAVYNIFVFPREFQRHTPFGTGIAFLEASGEVLFVNIEGEGREASREIFRNTDEETLKKELEKINIEEEKFKEIGLRFNEIEKVPGTRSSEVSVPATEETGITLMFPTVFFKNGELEKCRAIYGKMFEMTAAEGSGKDYIDNVLFRSKDKEKMTVALVPKGAAKEDLQKLIDCGIRFIMADDSSFADAKAADRAERKNFIENTCKIMLLVRAVRADMTDRSLCRMLGAFLKTYFGFDEKTAAQYIKAITSNDITLLVKGLLAFRPMVQYRTPEYEKVVAALLSA